ncbi:MAG TPA: sugar transferase [Paludibacter sp.]|nr:sugar transferase [Paludibacter sp.]
MKILYRIAYSYLILDIVLLLLCYYIVLDWLPLTAQRPVEKYAWPMLAYGGAWVVVAYLLRRYESLRKKRYLRSFLNLFYNSVLVFVFFWILLHAFFREFSGYVLLIITLEALLVNNVFLSLYYAFKLAAEYNEIILDVESNRGNAVARLPEMLDLPSYNERCDVISSHSENCVLEFLKRQVDLGSTSTFVFTNNPPENLKLIPQYRYSAIVQLERLNNIKQINKKLAIINEKLPDYGVFVCCFESKSTRKSKLLAKYPKGINYIIYSFDFVVNRIVPKIMLISPLYYHFATGNNRILSKAEVLGRLYCYGFRVSVEKKVGKLNYVVAERVKSPEPLQKKVYGSLIQLRRFGKDGVPFVVYKFRTMHPYSEYLQAYIYQRNSLKDGGKFNRDIRVTSLGGIMRKYWIDELPMFYNVFRGEMKLVGVRPLSAQYFNLYSKELQEKRNKFKPGLLPPFYVDLPRTLDDIQASEMKYLQACETSGVFITDTKYFFLIIKNILFKKARSS